MEQILVEVASTQMRTLRTEAGKVFMWTAFAHELVDSKRQAKAKVLNSGFLKTAESRKSIGLKFPNLLSWHYDGNVISVEFSHWDLGEELSFLYNMQ